MTRCETCDRRIYYRRRGKHGIAGAGAGRGDADHTLCRRCYRDASARLLMTYRIHLHNTTPQSTCPTHS